jgi:hypothetical protein
MKSSKPPALATWLVEHLMPRNNSEALAGDLSEQFSQGLSVAWYWRQVLVAILVSFSKELHILWVAASFTIVWIPAVAKLQAAFSWGMGLPWPFSEIVTIAFFTVLNAVPLLVSLVIYLSVRNRLRLRLIAQGFLGGIVGFSLGLIGGMVLPIHGKAGSFAGYLVLSMPLFFGLLVSLGVMRPTTKTVGAATSSE